MQTPGQHKGTGSHRHFVQHVGVRRELRKRAKNVRRGVGKNMRDHYVAHVSYPIVGAQTANERSRGLPLAGEVLGWLSIGKGMLTYSPSIVATLAKVLA